MKAMTIDKESLVKDLIDLVSEENIIFNDDQLKHYGLDPFNQTHKPFLVIKPSKISHFKRLNFILRRYKIESITPRGCGFGINLGAYSEDLIIDLTLLNQKIELDTQTLTVKVEAGVRYTKLQKILNENGYRLPIEPILDGTIGGFIATGGYGYGSYQFGSLMNLLRSTSIVLSNGQIIQSGNINTPPYSCGYNLNGLICGSEGYFGIITDAVLEITPIALESHNLLLKIPADVDLMPILSKLAIISTIHHISLYKGLIDTTQDSTNLLIRLEGPPEILEQDKSFIEAMPDITFSKYEMANKLWDNRILEPSHTPKASIIIEAIVPISTLSQFLKFWKIYNSPTFFGTLINPSSALLYTFFPPEIPNVETVMETFVEKSHKFQMHPPTIGHLIKKFVEQFHPNLEYLKRLKPIFDKIHRLKVRKLQF